MTPQPLSSTAKASVRANNPADDGAAVIVRDGAILCWSDGIFGPQRPAAVWSEWLGLTASPYPASQRRAAALRKALDQIGYLQ